jgi:lipoprotein-anchoring transpeptidase ErfK/SrfK
VGKSSHQITWATQLFLTAPDDKHILPRSDYPPGKRGQRSKAKKRTSAPPGRFQLMINVSRRRLLWSALVPGTALLLLPRSSARASEADWQRNESQQLEIQISKATQQLAVYIDRHLERVFAISTGAPGNPTPSGVFSIVRMHRMAYAPKYDNAPMPHSIFFTRDGHAIHGTGHLRTLGRPVSHGCVRLAPEAAEWLYDLVQEIGRRNTTIRVM